MAMERVTTLYKEASALRVLARRSEMLPIRDQLLGLALRCEYLAQWMEENPEATDLRRDGYPPDLH